MTFTANGQTLRLGSPEEHSNAQNGRKVGRSFWHFQNDTS